MISLKAQTVTGFMNTVNPVKKSPASVKANDFWPSGLVLETRQLMFKIQLVL